MTQLRRYFLKIKRVVRDFVILSFALGATWYVFHFSLEHIDVAAIASTLVSVSVTLLGFIIASVAILVSLNDRLLIKNMKRSNHYVTLICNMKWTAYFLSLSSVGALVTLFVPISYQLVCISVVVFFVVLSFSAFFIATNRLWQVMDILANKD